MPYTVISEPGDVTVCEGGSTILSCVLNGSITSDDVEWYRLVNGTNTAQRVSYVGDDFIEVPIPGQNSFTTRVYVFNARKSYTGYYWVRVLSDDVCNTSFTVVTGMFGLNCYTYICVIVYNTVHTYIHVCIYSTKYCI